MFTEVFLCLGLRKTDLRKKLRLYIKILYYSKTLQREALRSRLCTENTYCVTLGASRLRSASLLTTARSPPRARHCCRASVQLISDGTIWKQREDSVWYTPSFGQ